MNPQDRRCRSIVTHEGKFINVQDFKDALNDPEFVKYCAVMLAVGHQSGRPWVEVVQRCIGCAVMVLSGEEASALGKSNEKGITT